MSNEELPEGWSIFQAVLPFLPGKEGGSALHLDATAKKSNSWIFALLPRLSAAPCRGRSSYAVLLFSGGAHNWMSCFETVLSQEGTSRHFSGSQPGSFPAARFLGRSGPGGRSCPWAEEGSQLLEYKQLQQPHAVPISAFWETSPPLRAYQPDLHSLFACLS